MIIKYYFRKSNLFSKIDDNRVMKRINVIFIFTVLLSLSSCMPDSLTKFEEKSTKKQREKLSGGGTTGEGSVSHISSVYYNQAKGQKLVLKLSNSSEYALDGFISAEPGNVNGVTGKINYIEGSDIYAEITTTTITKDTKTFQKDTPVDNVEEYFTEEGTVSDDIIYTFSLGENIGDSQLGFFPHFETTATLDADDFTFELTPSLGNFASSGIYFVSKGTCYIQSASQFPSCPTAACTAQTIYGTKTSCESAGLVWAVGGTIHGTPTKAVQATSFALSVKDPDGNSTSTNFQMSLSEPPKGLSYSRTVLLHVPSASAFTENDAISSRSGGEGTVIGTSSSVNGTFNTGKLSQYEHDYIEVQIIKGTFLELDDLDNNARYGSQKTYVLGKGIIPYSVKVELTADDDFKDPFYDEYKINENSISIFNSSNSQIAKGRVQYFDKKRTSANKFYLYITITDEDDDLTTDLDGLVSSFAIQSTTATTITTDVIPNVTETIKAVFATNVIITTSSALTLGTAGHDITSDNGSATTAMINSSNISTATYNITKHEGEFVTGDSVDSSNPFSAGEATIQSVSSDKTFYLYRGDEAIINTTIDVIDKSNIKYTIDTGLPAGLSLDEDTGVISGTPTDAATLQVYTMTASSPYGKTTFTFNIKVNDQIIIRNNTESFSYIMHRDRKGKQRVNCRITEDQINSSTPGFNNTVNNINCYLEAGEQELYTKGAEIEIDIGADLCQNLSFTPYFTNQFNRGQTTPGSFPADSTAGNKVAYKHIGADAEQCPQLEEYSTTRAGGTPIGSVGINAKYSLFNDSPKYLCDFDHSLRDNDFPNCDTGSVFVREITYKVRDSGIGCVVDSEKTVEYDCGGLHSSCIAGPALSIMGAQSIDNGSFSEIYNINNEASKKVYKFEAPIQHSPIGYKTNISVANYIAPASCYAGDAYVLDTDQIIQHAVDLKNASVYNPMTNTNPVYRVNCTDGSGETKAFINLYIRDWDEAFKASDDIDLAHPGTLMDAASNDILDYEDILTGATDICDGTTAQSWNHVKATGNFMELEL